jgi:hypothetical protein
MVSQPTLLCLVLFTQETQDDHKLAGYSVLVLLLTAAQLQLAT